MLLQQQKAVRPHSLYILLLLLIAIVAYWQISFLKYSVTHDMINCWIPWRYYISNCIQNHTFPFWNPYQQLGYPIHADLQGPTWYLESFLLSMTVGQNNYTVQLLFIFYVFMAGMGIYFLSLCFHTNRNVAFLVGVSYMLSGFFVAHVQHLYAIIGAAWLPFIILNFYKMNAQKSYIHALYAAIFMFFNLTGGNHTFSIILVYLCLFIFAYFMAVAIKEKDKKTIIHYLKINLLFATCTILLATVVIVAYTQTASYVDRLSGLTYKGASIYPLTPQSLLSLFLPFSTVNGMDFYQTDPSMSNIYVGILMLIFVILAVFSKKIIFEKIILIFAVICLFASFGVSSPIHKFLFDFVPLMNLFRNPSYFSLLSIIILLIIGGNQLAKMEGNINVNFKKIRTITLFILLFILIAFVFAVVKNHGDKLFFLSSYSSIFDFLKASSFYQNIILQGSIQLLFLIAFIVITTSSLKKNWFKITIVLSVLNLIISTQLTIGLVGFSAANPLELKNYLATLPKGFPIPDTAKIINNTEMLGQHHGLYRNTSGFHKRISADVFNSYAFKNQSKLEESFPLLYKAMLNNPLFYFSNQCYPDSESIHLDSMNITNQTLVFADDDFKEIKKHVDTSKINLSESNVEITFFNPNEISLVATSSKQQLITLLQSYYGGWEATVDEKKSIIFVSNYLTMSILIPAGTHKITFQYKNPTIIVAAVVSYTVFFILLIFLSVFWWRTTQHKLAVVVIWSVLLFSSMYYFF
jgi:Bacterial membrane protein YfhO